MKYKRNTKSSIRTFFYLNRKNLLLKSTSLHIENIPKLRITMNFLHSAKKETKFTLLTLMQSSDLPDPS